MGKKSSNPLNSIKSTINKATSTASKTYDNVSKQVAKTATQIIPPDLIKNKQEDKPEIKHEIKYEIKSHIKPIVEKVNELPPFEKHIQSLYVGCFSDDPSNPTMETNLGDVSNSLECIELGKKNNYKYVGIQQGNKCYASNTIPVSSEADRDVHCNVGCDDINTGNCGGFFYNQVYRTNNQNNNLLNNIKLESEEKTNAMKILENFSNFDTDVEKINYGLSHVKHNCIDSIDPYLIFFWVVILVVLLYLLFEYIYLKSKKNI